MQANGPVPHLNLFPEQQKNGDLRKSRAQSFGALNELERHHHHHHHHHHGQQRESRSASSEKRVARKSWGEAGPRLSWSGRIFGESSQGSAPSSPSSRPGSPRRRWSVGSATYKEAPADAPKAGTSNLSPAPAQDASVETAAAVVGTSGALSEAEMPGGDADGERGSPQMKALQETRTLQERSQLAEQAHKQQVEAVAAAHAQAAQERADVTAAQERADAMKLRQVAADRVVDDRSDAYGAQRAFVQEAEGEIPDVAGWSGIVVPEPDPPCDPTAAATASGPPARRSPRFVV